MKTQPEEISEAALVDAPPVRQFFPDHPVPLCRPAFAGPGTSNDLDLQRTLLAARSYRERVYTRPITSSARWPTSMARTLHHPNLIAAVLMTAIPTLLVYFARQRQVISGLTIGSARRTAGMQGA